MPSEIGSYEHLSDAELIRKIKQDDLQAWETFRRRHGDKLPETAKEVMEHMCERHEETMSDEDLMWLVTRRSEHAFEILMKRHWDRVCSICCKRVRNRQDAENGVQEIFLKLWITPGLYNPDLGTFRNFITVFAIFQTLNLIHPHGAQGNEDLEEYVDPGPNPEELLEIQRWRERIETLSKHDPSCWLKLDYEELLVLSMFIMGGHNFDRIRKALQVHWATVRGLYQRAIAKLRKCMEATSYDKRK